MSCCIIGGSRAMVENSSMPMKKPNTVQVTKLRSSARARSKNGLRRGQGLDQEDPGSPRRPTTVSVQISPDEYQSWLGPRSRTSWKAEISTVRAPKPMKSNGLAISTRRRPS